MSGDKEIQPVTPPDAGPVLKAKLAIVRSLSRALAGTQSYQDLVQQLDALASNVEREFQASAEDRRRDQERSGREIQALEAATADTVRRLERDHAHQGSQLRDAIRALASALDNQRADGLRAEARALHGANALEALVKGVAHDRTRLKAIENLASDELRRAAETSEATKEMAARAERDSARLEAVATAIAELKATAKGDHASLLTQVEGGLTATVDKVDKLDRAFADERKQRAASDREIGSEIKGRLEALEARLERDAAKAAEERGAFNQRALSMIEDSLAGLRAQAEGQFIRSQDLFSLVDARIVEQSRLIRVEPQFLFADESGIGIKTSIGYLIFPRGEMNHALSWLNPGFDAGMVAAVRRLCEPGAHFIDIGSSIGAMSVVAASVVGSTGSVTLIDPISEALAYALKNMRLNAPLTPLRHFEAAVSDTGGKRTLQVFTSDTRISTIHPYAESALPSENREVDLIDAATILPKDAGLLVIKVDAEAEDLTIVRRLLDNARGEIRIIYEHSPLHFERAGVKSADIVSLAHFHSMEAHYIADDGSTGEIVTPELAMAKSGNVQLVRKS